MSKFGGSLALRLFLGGLGVVLGWWGGSGPWLYGLVGCPYYSWLFVTLYMALWRIRGAPPPLEVGMSSLVL